MSRNRRFLLLFVFACFVLIPIYFFNASNSRRTPSGQRSLVAMTRQMMPVLREDFNDTPKTARLFVFIRAEGAPERIATGLEERMARYPGKALRAFLVWEPGVDAKVGAPPNPLLALAKDVRISQFWDHERVIAGALSGGPVRHGSWLLYSAGQVWNDLPPAPAHRGLWIDADLARLDQALAALQ